MKDSDEFSILKKVFKNLGNQYFDSSNLLVGPGDDAGLFQTKKELIFSIDTSIENIHFPKGLNAKKIAYRSCAVAASDIAACGGALKWLAISLSTSSKDENWIEDFSKGVREFSDSYKVPIIGGDLTSGKEISISIGVCGEIEKKYFMRRSGAQENDLLIVSGDLGAAYTGLQVLEREKAVFKVDPNSQPDLSRYSYSIERQLKPEARKDIIELLEELKIVPTSMIDISDGVSSEIFHLSKSSEVGFHIFEDKLPVDPEVNLICEEFKFNSTTAALNGGEDYELLFTIAQKDFHKIKNHPFLSVIGHSVEKKAGCQLITGLGHQIELTAQGWQTFENR